LAQGRYDDAIIIITGDHGEEFKEQGSWFHGTMLNEPQTRVPILIKWPNTAPQGRGPQVDKASHLDLLPTLLDALGADHSLWQGMPGISLLHPPAGERTLVLTTHFCGKNGEAMLLRRGRAEASFGWRDYWQPIVPRELWIERVQNVPRMELEAVFGDAMPRIFQKLTADDGSTP
jgi:arylsulfatase A-like enzyme